MTTYGEKSYARVTQDLPGAGRLVQVWVLTVHGRPDDESHHAVVQCYVGDINVVANTRLPNDDQRTVVRDPGIAGWKSVPEDVQDSLSQMVPDGTTVLDGEGGEVRLPDGR